jgi:hypothetical protein
MWIHYDRADIVVGWAWPGTAGPLPSSSGQLVLRGTTHCWLFYGGNDVWNCSRCEQSSFPKQESSLCFCVTPGDPCFCMLQGTSILIRPLEEQIIGSTTANLLSPWLCLGTGSETRGASPNRANFETLRKLYLSSSMVDSQSSPVEF